MRLADGAPNTSLPASIPMLETISLSHAFKSGAGGSVNALDGISFTAPRGHLLGVIGATGSGKSTLVRLLAGDLAAQSGALLWQGRDISQQRLPANAVGIVGGEDSLHPLMSVKEHLVCAQMLAVGGVSKRDILVRADKLMLLCGIETVSAMRASYLTTPQRRRLCLAIALATEPQLVLCDGFADDLDPKSERELTALLKLVAQDHPWRIVINATQSLRQMPAFDTVLLLHEGCVCFHGPARAVTHYFSIPHTEELYHRLAMRPVLRWKNSWDKHRDSYYAAFKLSAGRSAASEADLGAASDDEDSGADRVTLRPSSSADDKPESPGADQAPAPAPPAGLSAQVSALFRRRWTVFRRAKTAMWTQAATTILAPLLMIAAMWPAVSQASASNPARQAVLASGCFILQAILLSAIAARTCSREIADRRAMWQREHRAGLGIGAYLAGKALFIGPIALIQAVLISMLPDIITGGLPGNAPMRVILCILAAIAFTALMLGTSAWSRTGDQSAARCWALALVQIPLSGALVLLPGSVAAVSRLLVTSGNLWAGSLGALPDTSLLPAFQAINNTPLTTPGAAAIMLLVHAVVGIVLTITGLKRTAR